MLSRRRGRVSRWPRTTFPKLVSKLGLSDAGFAEISYEHIVVEHPEEFSDHAVWYARRTLGLPNALPKPPSQAASRVREQTEISPFAEAGRSCRGPAVLGPRLQPEEVGHNIGLLDRRIERDGWGVRPSDSERFAPGQLGIIRVGVDRRSLAERNGAPLLEPGIYAVCEVESSAYPGTGATDEFWAEDAGARAGLAYGQAALPQDLSREPAHHRESAGRGARSLAAPIERLPSGFISDSCQRLSPEVMDSSAAPRRA